MKIARYYDENTIRFGILDGESLAPVEEEELTQGDLPGAGGKPMETRASISLESIRLAPPVTAPSKIIALGLNYRDHADESKGKIPENPLIFSKFPSSLTGPNSPITWDTVITDRVDYEAELAVVIGKRLRNCPEKDALDGVLGYTCANDVSARDLQFGDGQWVRGKSLDTFCPLGPWIVTADEIPDPNDLDIICRLNNRIVQESHTSRMIFDVPTVISFLSKHFTLFPGDVILTGTPHGVGAFREPPVYLKDGDKVEVEIEEIGTLVNMCSPKG